MYHEKTTVAARGKWKGILTTFGIPSDILSGKHTRCPLCDDGKDRFRFDNKEAKGTYICSQCGSGDGLKLAMEYTRRPFIEVASEIDKMLRNERLPTDKPKPEMNDYQRGQLLKKTYLETRKCEPGDLVFQYLASRGIHENILPDSLRLHPSMGDGNGGLHPAMVAVVGLPGQKGGVSMHRTFLRKDGSGKADIGEPRKLMPGALPDGACVMLSEYTGGILGIAEGIETAMSASIRFSMPVWAAISSNVLAKWMPPEGCKDVAIFGDNDPKFGGQAAAWGLAHRLAVKGFGVEVHIPQTEGVDWNDVLLGKGI